jgi:hypothetical protein
LILVASFLFRQPLRVELFDRPGIWLRNLHGGHHTQK